MSGARGSTFSYTYDYRTRRIGTRSDGVSPSATETQTTITFSGGLSVAEWESTTTNPQPGTTNPPSVEYTRGPDMGGGVGGLLYTTRRDAVPGVPTLRYNLSNGRGDIVAQSDSAAALTWTASYEAHGRRTTETGTNADKQRGNSKDEDPTGLLNEGFRYRDLETGVWLSRDPAGFVDGPNVYAYIQQNPWSKFDAEGLFWSALITAGFAAYDTYQYATGQTSGAEYAQAMALNGAALLADVATVGNGGGLAVRAANMAIKTAKVVDKANNIAETAQAAIETTETIVAAVQEGDGRGIARAVGGALADAATDRLVGGKKKGDGDFRGGPHSQTSKPANDGKDSHHMPAKDVSGIPEKDGPAIQMDPHDHKKTSSNGSVPGNTEYREMIGDMIDGGDMRGAMATEIRDVRRASLEGSGDRTKYNGAMTEMMEYAKKEGYVPDNPKRRK